MTTPPTTPPTQRKRRPLRTALSYSAAAFSLGIIALITLWQWDWFVPLINRQATAALHRPASITHLHVSLGLKTSVTVDGLRVGQPAGFEHEKQDFASAASLTVKFDVWRYITKQGLFIPVIRVETPQGDIVSLLNGHNNYSFDDHSSKAQTTSSSSKTELPHFNEITIHHADIRIALAKLKTDMHLRIHTTEPDGKTPGSITLDINGRYAQAPITGHLVGGALLSLASHTTPYPIDGKLENGPTYITLRGTVDDPTAFKGTHLALHFAGPDMALLYALTGVPIPHTPAYNVTGNLGYSQSSIRFDEFEGRMGSSDIGGDIHVDPHQKPIYVESHLHSRNVDLADLGGFIGAKTGTAPPAPKNSTAILPTDKIDVPKLNAANALLTYHGNHIENKNWPLDNIDTAFTVHNGAITLDHLTFATATGHISAAAKLDPATAQQFHTHVQLDVSRLPLSRVMKPSNMFQGQGTIGGHVTLTSTGNSVATLVANGSGGITLVLDRGGNITALLPDLLGLKLGAAVLSALGIPDRSKLDCLVADMPLENGILKTRSLLLQTGTTRTTGNGSINFRNDTLDYAMTTRAVHPQILSLPGAIHISGPIASPTILPGAELVGRVAATIGLGILFPPAALLPTIQFGVGEGSACEQALSKADNHPAAGIAPGSTTSPAPKHAQHMKHKHHA
ncbi:AsmA family protein [Neokomagataea anthophila]|uniref:AsmA family protein n=1 Tax=Neokomagataea anthophila TaxID=2826925 RepID=A0ABS5E677_9PROT|nr:AsmA family protein [Neokomagataea anthophila]MBR0559013.1 AsmA family protein [Neokomagataea anthophila]